MFKKKNIRNFINFLLFRYFCNNVPKVKLKIIEKRSSIVIDDISPYLKLHFLFKYHHSVQGALWNNLILLTERDIVNNFLSWSLE